MLIGKFRKWRINRRLRKMKEDKLIHGWGFSGDNIVLYLPATIQVTRIHELLSGLVPSDKLILVSTDVPKVFFRPEDWRKREKIIRLGISACGASSTACSLTALYKKGKDILVGVPGHCTAFADTCKVPLSEMLVHPSPIDGGTSNDIVADLYECYDYYAKDYITVDQCLFKLRPGIAYEASIFGNGPVKGYLPQKDVKPGAVVHKSGRTTGITNGVVISTNTVIDIDFICRVFEVRNAVVITAMSQPGDSGAPVYTDDGKIIGYVIGGTDLITVSGSIEGVLKYFNVELLTS